MTGRWSTPAEQCWWQRRAAAELTSILAVHQDLPAIGWTVAPVGCVLAGHVNGLAPAEQVREVFSGWRSALGLDSGPGEHVGDAGAVHLQAMAYRRTGPAAAMGLQWVPVLAARAPRLLAATADPPTIIITALTGVPLSRAQFPAPAERDAHEQAGALLAAFHAAAAPASTTNIPAWLAARGGNGWPLPSTSSTAASRPRSEHTCTRSPTSDPCSRRRAISTSHPATRFATRRE